MTIDKSLKIKERQQVKASGEIAYSQLPALTEVTNNTILSAVESAANFKVDLKTLKDFLNE